MYEDGWLGKAWCNGYQDGYHNYGRDYLSMRGHDYRNGWMAGFKDQERGKPMYIKEGKQGDLFRESH